MLQASSNSVGFLQSMVVYRMLTKLFLVNVYYCLIIDKSLNRFQFGKFQLKILKALLIIEEYLGKI